MGLYESDENCIEVIGHYLAHPELRERMAKAGYEWTLAHATWDLRIEELLKLV
jgi:spore maturation protein CgeB